MPERATACMQINNIILDNFRSYAHAETAFAPGVNVIYGENGRGKTNLLEAVYLNCGLGSWRASKKEELVRWGESVMSQQSRVEIGGMERALRMAVADGRRAWTRDGVRINPSETGFMCVLFEPGELELVQGSGAKRRRFMDNALFQLRPQYRALWREYASIIQKKTSALKQGGSYLELLPEYGMKIAVLGERIASYRRALVKKLAESADLVHREMSAGREKLQVRYKTVKNGSDADNVTALLKEYEQVEIAARRCLIGVHHDDMEIEIDGRAARAFASQGQARTASVALITALREVMMQDRGEYPVLILDDVFSELDEKRRGFLVDNAMGGQVLISSCEPRRMAGPANYIEVDSLLRTKG